MPNQLTISPSNSGSVFLDTFTFSAPNLTPDYTTYSWDFGDGTVSYDTFTASRIYRYPGTYNITMSAWKDDGSTPAVYTGSVGVKYVYQNKIIFSQVPDSYSDPGQPTATPFVVSLTSTEIQKPISIILQAINSNSIPFDSVPDKWNSIVPKWKFINSDTNEIVNSITVDTNPIYSVDKNGVSRVVAVSGDISFYYIDDSSTKYSTDTNASPVIIAATVDTSNFVYPPESNYYPYDGYMNSDAAKAAVLWQVNNCIPTDLKITENFLNDIYPVKWTGIPIPVMITCTFNSSTQYNYAFTKQVTANVLEYPSGNFDGSLYPVFLSLSSNGPFDETYFTVGDSQLFFSPTDSNGGISSGYIFTTITPLSSTDYDVVVAASTAAIDPVSISNKQKNIVTFPVGYPIYSDAYIPVPTSNKIAKINIVNYPSTDSNINYYKNLGVLVDGQYTSLTTPTITSLGSQYGNAIYGIAFNPLLNTLYATDSNLDSLYTFGLDKTNFINLSSITGDPINIPGCVSTTSYNSAWVSCYKNRKLLNFDHNLNLLTSIVIPYNTVPSDALTNTSDNVVQYSDQIGYNTGSTKSWSVSSNLSVQLSSITSPSNLGNATKLTLSADGEGYIQETGLNIDSLTNYRGSVFFKPGSVGSGKFEIRKDPDVAAATFESVSGTITPLDSNAGFGSNASWSVVPYPNNWYRLITDFTSTHYQPTLYYDFVASPTLTGGIVGPAITFTRNSSATYIDSTGVLRYVGPDVPRFDYTVTNTVTSSNLLLFSSVSGVATDIYSNRSGWIYTDQVSLSSVSWVTAPDGSKGAIRVQSLYVGQGSIGNQMTSQFGSTYSESPSGYYAISAFVKPVSGNYCSMMFDSLDNLKVYATFNLTTGVAGLTSQGLSAISASVLGVSGDWSRLGFVVYGPNNKDANKLYISFNDTGRKADDYVYDGINGTGYLWGVQVEQNSSVGTYVYTTSSIAINYASLPTITPNGLLIESTSTNLAISSSMFPDSTNSDLQYQPWFWSDGGYNSNPIKITPNYGIAPDGTQTACRIQNTSNNYPCWMGQTVNYNVGDTYTASFYAKNISLSSVRQIIGFGDNINVYKGILTNNWKRFSWSFVYDGISFQPQFRLVNNQFPPYDYLIWGAQVEKGIKPTSYTPTVGISYKRQGDYARIEQDNFNSIYNLKEGTIVIEANTKQSNQTYTSNPNVDEPSLTQLLASTNEQVSPHLVSLVPDIEFYYSSTTSFSSVDMVGRYNDSLNSLVSFNPSTFNKFAFSFDTSFVGSYANSVSNSQATLDQINTPNVLALGSGFDYSNNNLNGYIKSIRYYPNKLSDFYLQNYTDQTKTYSLSSVLNNNVSFTCFVNGLSSDYNYWHGAKIQKGWNDVYEFATFPVIETDKQDDLWVGTTSKNGGALVKYSADGIDTIKASNFDSKNIPISIGIDFNNNAWVACSGTNNILSYSPTGALLDSIVGFTYPNYIAVDKNNNIWFTHGYNYCSVYYTNSKTLSTWKFDTNTNIVIESSESSTDPLGTVWGGLTVDVYDRVWALNSLTDTIYIFKTSEPTNVRIISPSILSNSNTLLNPIDSNIISTEFLGNSSQVVGDWTGNKWYQKYSNSVDKIYMDGVSTPFKVKSLTDSYKITKVNEEFDYAAYTKSLALPQSLQQTPEIFDQFISAVGGDGNPTTESIGRITYEKIANFVSSHGDYETADIDQLLSYAEQLSVPVANYGTDFPRDIDRLINIFSAPKTALRGLYNYDPNIENNIGALLTETDSVTAGTYIYAKDKKYSNFEIIYVTTLPSGGEDSIEVYPITDLNVSGLRTPLLDNYYLFNYDPYRVLDKSELTPGSSRFVDNLINWDSSNTTVGYTLSTNEEWYGDGGLVETVFNNELTQKLFAPVTEQPALPDSVISLKGINLTFNSQRLTEKLP